MNAPAGKKLDIDARVADLERGEFEIPPSAFDLICDCYYLQRSLIPAIQRGLRPGGMAIVIVHLADADQPEGTPTRAMPGELRKHFDGWTILHYYEGRPHDVGLRHRADPPSRNQVPRDNCRPALPIYERIRMTRCAELLRLALFSAVSVCPERHR